jgi:plastocyanin
MPRTVSVRGPTLVALALACAALGACGGQDPVTIETRTLQVKLDEYRIMPQNANVRPGVLRIQATNVGRLTHNLKVVRLNRSDRELPPDELGGTPTAQPGDTVTFTFRHLKPGTYRMVCTISNHDDLGQYGDLVVEPREEP